MAMHMQAGSQAPDPDVPDRQAPSHRGSFRSKAQCGPLVAFLLVIWGIVRAWMVQWRMGVTRLFKTLASGGLGATTTTTTTTTTT